MVISGLIFLGLAALVIAFIVITDGTYLGKRGVRFIYDRMAKHWSYPTSPKFRANDEKTLLPHIESAIASRSAARLLDIATGTGRVPLLVASQPWFDGSISAIDVSPNMLARAASNLRSAGLEDVVELKELDASRTLPWEDGSFQVITCIEALLNFPNPGRALKEMVRVLEPGGSLIISKVSDLHARLVPGKAWTKKGFIKQLSKLGIADVGFEPFDQVSPAGGDELVIARKDVVEDGQHRTGARRESSWA